MKLSNAKPLIDELGRVKAEIARLKVIEDSLKDQIVAMGPGAYEGELFRATVSECTAERLDMKAVREKLSAQFIRAHTSVTEFFRVDVKARTGKFAA
jgi:hypothetical protein